MLFLFVFVLCLIMFFCGFLIFSLFLLYFLGDLDLWSFYVDLFCFVMVFYDVEFLLFLIFGVGWSVEYWEVCFVYNLVFFIECCVCLLLFVVFFVVIGFCWLFCLIYVDVDFYLFVDVNWMGDLFIMEVWYWVYYLC